MKTSYALLLLAVACRDKDTTSSSHDTTADSAAAEDSAVSSYDRDTEALPAHASATDGAFTTHDACAECHEADSSTALRDEDGRDVSPVTLWSGSMMANSARDPYYLARLAHELEAQPVAEETIIATCTRCHAPAASELNGGTIDLEGLLTGTEDIDHLARSGTTCTLCHQITDEGLGTDESFTGGFVIGEERKIFGPHEDPFEHPMEMHVDYVPTYSEHMLDSATCATCHTVITEAIDAETGEVIGEPFPEQVPYLEWRNSSFETSGVSCQDCHMPQSDEDGDPISTRIATKPTNGQITERDFLGRHLLVGGNAYMLELMAANADWTNPVGGAAAMQNSAAATESFLANAAALSLVTTAADGQLSVDVTIANLAGHKLPTAYPSRRVFVRLTVSGDDGAVLWRSGRTDDDGRLVDASGADIDGVGVHPHRDTVTGEEQVQVYESVMHNISDQPTDLLFQATHYGKDNRLLPQGWSASHDDAAMTAPIGTDKDADYTDGQDTVHYQLTFPDGAASVTAELIYQALPVVHVEALSGSAEPLVSRLIEMTTATPDTGRTIVSATETL